MPTALTGLGHVGLITATIASELTADLGNNDLSATGSVIIARVGKPPRMPFVSLLPMQVSSDEAGPSLGLFERRAEVFVEGWSATAANNATGSYAAGSTLANEVMQTTEAMHRETGGALIALGVRNLYFSEVEFLNAESSSAQIGHFRATLVFTYATPKGL